MPDERALREARRGTEAEAEADIDADASTRREGCADMAADGADSLLPRASMPHIARAHPDRARQFMPFAALRGYDELIRQRTRRAERAAEGASATPRPHGTHSGTKPPFE